ncbi:multiple sugar transport system substrate-binding protein [Actinomyces ruminicola]|uniref:Multiple sugar transport system substrate-binding protein n=1 Tax=Actinomyces ruminicola TaxID=332524 RepID=A0A1H0DQ47_9ACTO|nr:ABC transporter substrate-binding protein [Actinomyces ruminicola]SDN72294.1 multiple sugar transport system substrate-binding protein [Actinomyces ruminicola]
MASRLPRRRFIQGSAVVAALSAAAACSGSGSGGGGSAPSAASAADFTGTGPITWVQGKDNSDGKVQARIDEWNELYPDEKVTLIELSAEADQQRQSLINNAQTQSDAYDVISIDNVWVAEFAANQWVVPLPEDDLKNDDIVESVWQTGLYMDRLYGMPFATDSSIMFYRKDFLEEAGVEVPTTWDEVKSAIDAVRALPGHEKIGGFGGQFAKYEGLTCCASEFINTAGGSFYDDEGNVTINSPEAIAGLQVLIDGFKDGYIPKEALEWKEEDGRNAFESGDLLFYRQWPYQYANNMAALGEEKFGVAALPTIDGKDFVPTLGGHNCGISAYSKNKATALKFVQWWTSQESEKYALETQTLAPILGSLYEDSEMLEQFPYLPTLRESLDSAKGRPKAVSYGDVTAAIQDALYPAVQQQVTAEEAISNLETALKALS